MRLPRQAFLKSTLSAVIVALSPAALAQTPSVQPGPPGEPPRTLDAEEAMESEDADAISSHRKSQLSEVLAAIASRIGS